MGTDLSPENERFIEHVIAQGVFADRKCALDEAVGLLKRRQKLLDQIEEGTQQLRSGDLAEYDQSGLRRFFDEVQAE